jgi:hypothetical protein
MQEFPQPPDGPQGYTLPYPPGYGYPLANPNPTPRRGLAGKKWLILGGLALALGAGIVIGVNILPTYAASLAATPTPGTHQGGLGWGLGKGGPGFRGERGPLTVASVSGNTITAMLPNGNSVTIHTSSSTTYGRAGVSVSANAIVKGDTIAVKGQRNSDGSIAAKHIEIVLPHVAGTVTAISGNTLTLKSERGSTTSTVHVLSSATIQRAGQTAGLSDIHIGDTIAVAGTQNSDKSFNAERVEIILPHAGGQITKISGSDITVSDHGGGALVIHTTASTKFVTLTKGANGPVQSTTALGSLKVGDFIVAEGTKNSDGSITALTVSTFPAGARSWGAGHGDTSGKSGAAPAYFQPGAPD